MRGLGCWGAPSFSEGLTWIHVTASFPRNETMQQDEQPPASVSTLKYSYWKGLLASDMLSGVSGWSTPSGQTLINHHYKWARVGSIGAICCLSCILFESAVHPVTHLLFHSLLLEAQWWAPGGTQREGGEAGACSWVKPSGHHLQAEGPHDQNGWDTPHSWDSWLAWLGSAGALANSRQAIAKDHYDPGQHLWPHWWDSAVVGKSWALGCNIQLISCS